MLNFKKALKTTIIFVLCIFVISVGLSEIYFQGENSFYQDAKERDALSGSVNYIISGASHGLRAFKPSIIDQELDVNCYNLSGAGMTMKGRYELLSIELERNPIETVVIELSYNSMTRNRKDEGPEGDLYVLGRFNSFSKRVGFFAKAFYPSEYGQVYYDTINRGVTSLKNLVTGNYTTELSEFYKGYFPTPKPDTKLDDNYSEIHNTREYETEIDDESVQYLDKIIALCKQHGTRIILVTTPLSELVTCKCSNLDVFYNWYKEYAYENELEFYDFNLLKEKQDMLPDELAYYDAGHLNDTGADIFGMEYCRIMRMVDAGEDISDLFYGSYDELDASCNY